jgi:hypothetical protein
MELEATRGRCLPTGQNGVVVESYDLFLSYAHADRAAVLPLRAALDAHGLRVYFDDEDIEDLASIKRSIERGLAHSKALVAYYSLTYPTRRACQWELTAAFLAAARHGDPSRRVLVFNPETSADHVDPAVLRDHLFANGADQLAAQVRGLEGELGDLGVSVRPRSFGQTPIGSSRFVGRVVDMWAIHNALHADDAALSTGPGSGVALVTGMGGIGKSSLAEEYAMRFGAAYPGGVFWLRALGHDDEGESPVEKSNAERDGQLLGFAAALEADLDGLPPEWLRPRLARALDERGQPFVWIVDDLRGKLPRSELDGWLAPGRFGKTLVTTQSLDYAAIGTQVRLGVLGEADGVELLSHHRLPEGEVELQAARGLVADLGGHALALEVAGAALKAAHGVRTFTAYRAALKDPSADELELSTRYVGELPSGHKKSIASTLSRSIAQLDDAGRDFLRLASRLAAQPIPADLVADVFARVDSLDADAAQQRAIGAMHAAEVLSLADSGAAGVRQVHTLVSRTARFTEQRVERADALAGAAVESLVTRLRRDDSTLLPADEPTLAHARHLASPPLDGARIQLLELVIEHDFRRGAFRSAAGLAGQLVPAWQGALGDQHPATLVAMARLAGILRRMGDLTVARDLNEQVLHGMRRSRGPEHPDTLAAMNGLGLTLYDMGDLAAARTLQDSLLEASVRTLGPDDPRTLVYEGNLALILRASGDLKGALFLQRRSFDVNSRTLGLEHRMTLSAMNVLAGTLRLAGRSDEARAMQQHVVATRRRILGGAHPDTLGAMNNLAVTLQEMGDAADAHALLEGV